MKTHLFIDADLVAFRAAAESSKRKVSEASIEADHQAYFNWLTRTVPADKITLCFTGKTNFRKELNRKYKAGRVTSHKPSLLGYSQGVLKEMYPSIQVERLEADDILGINCTEPQDDEHRILVSYDKDLLTVPVTIYNTLNNEWSNLSADAAERLFWTQCITGDATDGYYGLPGVGAVGAKPLVDELMAQPKWNRVNTLIQMYAEYYLPADYALRQCQMAYILRHGDVDEAGRIRLFGTEDYF